MARARNIKPAFFRDADLADCSPLARLLFIYLWTEADKEGRLEDKPRQIKACGLPYDDCDADELLNELHAGGFIKRYQGGGKNLIWVVNFKKHQNPHPKEPDSELAEYCEAVEKNFLPLKDVTNLASSPFPLPSSLIPQPPTEKGGAEHFEEFWLAYPSRRKGEKPQCLKFWQREKLDAQAEAVLAGLEGWKASWDWRKDNGQYIKAPLPWLRGRFWENPPVTQSTIQDFGGEAAF